MTVVDHVIEDLLQEAAAEALAVAVIAAPAVHGKLKLFFRSSSFSALDTTEIGEDFALLLL